mmetsp:Transcript_43450/g.69524  ORF Transcript_43450/g.69524 Transcript_43450/m.69524 type:complete len:475 (+) Transcript_43450:101-1525(+)|eukprot:CAMPEP_0203744506 /NCGR_PEP_ID=MMETSP0098-20131031/550_1 /ASSEMBLY_ACC=CAM_ASM_000208 /TAXON_ID=96639 /ORGANISM=" , Strain NY0313808BC1" /LENGTH=474 /DNA_ID=CAMNT_0050632041 /DNA_START=91 /DNA_END=1515 /DNA_ORIENTATION=-
MSWVHRSGLFRLCQQGGVGQRWRTNARMFPMFGMLDTGLFQKNDFHMQGPLLKRLPSSYDEFVSASLTRRRNQDGKIRHMASLPQQNTNESPPEASAAPPLSWTTVQRALIGNAFITFLKFGVYFQTGSSAMLSEAIHTLADSGNQALLLAGLHQSSKDADKRFQYGYGRAAFFWALISALGMFWTGAGVTIFHGGYNLLHPEAHTIEMNASLWGVLAVSFAVDGWVLGATLKELNASKPSNLSMLKYLRQVRDPFILAVLLEDFTACTGVLIASLGIGATYITGNTYWDAMASIGIGALLGFVALRLVRMNQTYLLGQAIDTETSTVIRNILLSTPSVEAVYETRSQWIGPSAFSFKAEVDFDGTFLAAHLEEKYAPLFQTATELDDVEVLMSWYAEDVTRLVEREVRQIEEAIRQQYPAAAYIELEPDSKNANVVALPDDTDSHSTPFEHEKEEMEKLDREILLQQQRHKTK